MKNTFLLLMALVLSALARADYDNRHAATGKQLTPTSMGTSFDETDPQSLILSGLPGYNFHLCWLNLTACNFGVVTTWGKTGHPGTSLAHQFYIPASSAGCKDDLEIDNSVFLRALATCTDMNSLFIDVN